MRPAGKKTYKHHIFAPTTDARNTIFPKFCMVIEDIETIKKGVNRFSIQRSFCYRVLGKFRGK